MAKAKALKKPAITESQAASGAAMDPLAEDDRVTEEGGAPTPDDHSAGARIKRLREAAGLTLKQLAALMETQTSQIWKIENNEKRLTLELITKLTKALKCAAADIEPELGVTHRTVPVMGYLGRLDKYYPDPRAGHWAPCGQAPAPPGPVVEGMVALKVQGDDLYPTYCDGDIVYFVPNLPEAKGADLAYDRRHCILHFPKGEMYLKIPNSNYDGEDVHWTFDSPRKVANPPRMIVEDQRDETDGLWDWISPIVWVKRASNIDD